MFGSKLLSNIKGLHSFLDKKQNIHLSFILFLSVISTFLEISFITLFAVIANKVLMNIDNNYILELGYDYIYYIYCLVLLLLLKSYFQYLKTKYNSEFSFGIMGITIHNLIFKYSQFSYNDFLLKKQSDLSKNITQEALHLSYVILAYIVFLSETILLVAIFAYMLYINYFITIIILVLGLIVTLLIKSFIFKRVGIHAIEREKNIKDIYQLIHKIFNNFIFLKLVKESKYFVIKKSDLLSKEYSSKFINMNILGIFPKIIYELAAFSLFLTLFYLLIEKSPSLDLSIEQITFFVLALSKLLPSIGQLVSQYQTLIFNYPSLEIVSEELKLKEEKISNNNIEYLNSISTSNLTMQFDNKTILDNINITINKKDKIVFVGESGSGKTTLVKSIIGLIKQTSGDIKIDNTLLSSSNIQSWRDKIGYMMQEVILFDGTISENITFGRNYNEGKVIEVLKHVDLYEHFLAQEGLSTKIGDLGGFLSGGQKQRVGLARVLYGDPEVLVLDEITSALDSKTEKEIMNNIHQILKDKTVLMITHKEFDKKMFNRVFLVKDKKVIENSKEEY